MIGLVLVGGACFATEGGNVGLVLVLAVVADLTFGGGGHKFFASRAIGTVVERVVFGNILTVV